MLFNEKDKPRKRGGLFKKLLILFNLLMIINLVMVKHIENLQNRKPPQAVADLGGDEHDFVNQQERVLSSIHSDGTKAFGVIESDLDRALLGLVAEHPKLYNLLNKQRYILWVAGLLIFVGIHRMFRRPV